MAVARQKFTRKFGQFEELIKEQRRRLRQRLAVDTSSEMHEGPDDEGAAAARSQIEDLELDTRQRRFKLLSDIEFALRRLKAGTYGICDSCGEEISERRLQALPWTQLCLECAEKRQGSLPN